MNKPRYNFNAIPEPKWGNTIAALSQAVEAYDKDKERKDKIRICWDTLKAIFWDFAKKYKTGQTKKDSFFTTHVYMSSPVKRSPRTIARHINRLKEAGFIISKNYSRQCLPGKDHETNGITLAINLNYLRFEYKALETDNVSLYEIADFLSTVNVLDFVEEQAATLFKRFILFVKT